MLRKLSEQIRFCRKRLTARATGVDQEVRADDPRCRQAGLKLGGGYGDCLAPAVNEKMMLKGGRGIGHVTDDGRGGGAAWVERPERRCLGNDTKPLESELTRSLNSFAAPVTASGRQHKSLRRPQPNH
jgi:hypothetical protein